MAQEKIAVIGRPNVGKSSIFNLLCRKKLAIVDDIPGVTRDRQEYKLRVIDKEAILVDTAGLDHNNKNELSILMNAQTEKAVLEASLVIFVVDGIAGLTPEDKNYAKWLRKFNKKIILLINKTESLESTSPTVNEFHRLGVKDMVMASAAHNYGFSDLLEIIYQNISNNHEKEESDSIRLAIVGRPNVGKSTIINTILKEERLIVGDMAGITRDSISVDHHYKNTLFKIFDTAGVRKRKNIDMKLEKLSVSETKEAIKFANICALVIDAGDPLEKQDLTIAEEILKEGRGVVLVVNKIDLVSNPEEFIKKLKNFAEKKLSDVKDMPIVYCSAKSGKNISKILDEAIKVSTSWAKKISTSRLNNWLKDAEDKQPVPLNSQGKRPKLKFMAQVKSKPPYFVIYTNFPNDIPKTYVRYLCSSIKQEFSIAGTIVRVHFRKSDNPYDKPKK